MSEQHLELIAERMMREHDIAIELDHPIVIYYETIRSNAESEGRYIRQTGATHNYAHVMIRISPNEPGQGYEFSNETSDGSIPSLYLTAIEEGIQSAMRGGVLIGSEMIDIKVVLFDGSYHEVDSNEMSFRIAASMAFKEAARKAQPTVLEPFMEVEINVPEEHMGAIIIDINSRRGRIEDIKPVDGRQVITASIPLSTTLGYANTLKSLAQSHASCSMRFKQLEAKPHTPFGDSGAY